jgi:tetratricopeptide (TPR) repeat protein
MLKAPNILVIVLLIFSCASCATNHRVNIKEKVRALEDLGASFYRQGDLRLALERLLEAEKLDPRNGGIHHKLGLVYRDLKEYEISLKHFKKALALKPEFPEAQNNLGTLYFLLKEWDLAIGCFKKAADDILYKTPHFAYRNMGLAYYNKGEYLQAIKSYQEALSLSPEYIPCYDDLAMAYEALERWDLAIQTYEKSIAMVPDYPISRLNLAKLYLRLDRKDEATEELKMTMGIDPDGHYGSEAKELMRGME